MAHYRDTARHTEDRDTPRTQGDAAGQKCVTKKFSPSGLSAPPVPGGRRRHALSPSLSAKSVRTEIPVRRVGRWSGGEEFRYPIEDGEERGAVVVAHILKHRFS